MLVEEVSLQLEFHFAHLLNFVNGILFKVVEIKICIVVVFLFLDLTVGLLLYL